MGVLMCIHGVRRRGLKTTALLITATLCLLVIRKIDINNYNPLNKPENTHFKSQSLKSPSSEYKCERNVSVTNLTGFSNSAKEIQDFLFYRHCRHFPMLLNVPDKCGGPENSNDVFLLLAIKSFPPNYERREVLRKTWASERLQDGIKIRTVFITGTTGKGAKKEKLNKLLKLENLEYQDIIQWNFSDTFLNLTLKQVLFLQWMESFCPRVRFILNGDDDIFANTDNIVQYLKGLDGNKHLFIGHVVKHVGPIRIPGSKYFVPVQIQETDWYPPYCSGGGFLVSGFTSRIIYNMSHSIPLLPIDDVYIGMCLHQAGLKPMSHIGVRISGLRLPAKTLDTFDPCYYREILLVHQFPPHEIYVMWHEIHREDIVCGKRKTFV